MMFQAAGGQVPISLLNRQHERLFTQGALHHPLIFVVDEATSPSIKGLVASSTTPDTENRRLLRLESIKTPVPNQYRRRG